jgi:hypothetical protein
MTTDVAPFNIAGMAMTDASQIRSAYAKGDEELQNKILTDLYGKGSKHVKPIFDQNLAIMESIYNKLVTLKQRITESKVDEEKKRLDPSCWKGYKKQGTKMKGDTRVNNCVPVEEAGSPAQQAAIAINMKKRHQKPKNVNESQVTKITDYDLWLDEVKELGAEIHPQKDRNVLVAQSWDGEEIGKFHLGKGYGFISQSGELDETIRKMGSQYRLLSKKGKNLGTFDSKSGAEKHEREVQYFKHKGMSEATDDPFQQKTDQMQQSLLDRMGKRFGLPPGSTMDQVQAAQQAHLDKNDPAAAAQYKQNMTNIDAGNTAANQPVQLAPKPIDPDAEAGMSAAKANKSPIAIMLAQPTISKNQAMLDVIAPTLGLPTGSSAEEILAADDARNAKAGNKYAKSAAAPVTESTSRATDAKGRTQQEWIRLVKSKFSGAKIIQAKMIDGPIQAILPDGKKLFWKKDEQGIDEELSRRGFLKGLGAAALAGAVGLGSGSADAQNIDLPGPQVSYVAHVSAEANGREVHRSMNLGTRYSSEEEAYADIENSLQEKGITRYNIRIEQKYDMPSYSSDQPSGGTATGRNYGNPGIGDMISGRINREIRAGIPSKGGYATGGTNRGQRERDGSQWWRDRLPQIMREEALEEDIERHLLQMRRAGYDIVQEEWSDKYKSSINCSNPKGFSQKAHCAGKKKNESVAEEKVRLDPKCWSGKKIGNPKTKMKGGVRVNNCVPK